MEDLIDVAADVRYIRLKDGVELLTIVISHETDEMDEDDEPLGLLELHYPVQLKTIQHTGRHGISEDTYFTSFLKFTEVPVALIGIDDLMIIEPVNIKSRDLYFSEVVAAYGESLLELEAEEAQKASLSKPAKYPRSH